MKQCIFGILMMIGFLSYGQSSDATLTTSAQQIKNETTAGANTATRVGNMLQAIIDGKLSIKDYSTASGTNTYTATVSSAITSLAAGDIFKIVFTNGNSGASTLNLNSLGAKSIVKNGSTTLSSGDINAGQAFIVWYDGTNFQIIGGGGSSGAGTWGSITGTLSSQTDLQTALNAKQSSITFGTGVQTALGVNIGSVGAPVLLNDALGTPSSGTLTNATGLPPTTGISGWPANSSGVLTNNGSGTLSWGTSLTNPMTTQGDIIVGGTSGAAGRLAIGLNNSYLKSNGTALSYLDFPQDARNASVYINTGSTLNWFGDSYANPSFQATTANRGFVTIVSNALTSAAPNNYAVSGTGWFRAAFAHYSNVSAGTTNPAIVHAGFNDSRRGGSASKTVEKIKSCTRALIANQFLASAIPANNGSVTTSGVWSTTSGIGDKASTNLSGLVRTSTANGATLTYTFTLAANQSLVIGTFSTDEVTTLGGDFTYAIDGGSAVTYTGKNKTDGLAGAADSPFDNSICPNAIVVTGLSAGSHTVVITTVSTSAVRIDYFGIMADPRFAAPVIINSLPKETATGYATAPNTNGSDAAFDACNAAILSVVNEFPVNSPIIYNDYNTNGWNPTIHVGADNVHPNDLGYYALAQSILKVVKSNSSSFLNSYNYNTDNSGFIGMSGTSDNLVLSVNRSLPGNFVNTSKAAALLSIRGANGDGSIHGFTASANNTTPTENFTLTKTGLGLSQTSPAYLLDLIQSGTTASLHLSSSASDNGLYIRSAGAGNGLFLSGADYNGTNYVAKNTSAAIIAQSSGTILFYNNTGLTAGNTFTPTQVANFTSGRLFVGGSTSATANLHLAAGTATASTAPLKFTSGTNLTAAEAGAMEYDGTSLFFTPGSPTVARYRVDVNATVALTPAATISVSHSNASVLTLVPNQATTLNASGGVTGQTTTYVITTSGTSSFVITWGTNYKTTGTLTTGTVSGKVFTVQFVYDGTNWNEVARTTAM